MQLEMLPAKKGDCLILHYEVDGVRTVALIDGGPAGVYDDTLRPRLLELANGLPQLALDVVLVSHIDDDHVNGILALAREMQDAKLNGRQQSFRVDRLWHNSFERLTGAKRDETSGADPNAVVASVSSGPLPAAEAADEIAVLASIGQGYALADAAKDLAWPVNPEFGGEPIVALDEARSLRFGHATVTVVGPLEPELEILRRNFDRWLARRQQRPSAEEMLAAYADGSVANLSSIVLLVEEGGRCILLTGDARGDKIIAGLEAVGRLAPAGVLDLDVLKMPHHGSSRNVEPDFLRRLPSRTYAFSGDGEHGNPDRETLEMLFAARPEGGYELCFTYPLADIDERHAEERTSEGHHFDGEAHGIETLLRDHRPPGVTVRVPDGRPMML